MSYGSTKCDGGCDRTWLPGHSDTGMTEFDVAGVKIHVCGCCMRRHAFDEFELRAFVADAFARVAEQTLRRQREIEENREVLRDVKAQKKRVRK